MAADELVDAQADEHWDQHRAMMQAIGNQPAHEPEPGDEDILSMAASFVLDRPNDPRWDDRWGTLLGDIEGRLQTIAWLADSEAS